MRRVDTPVRVSAQPVLDHAAIEQYRQRLSQLRADIEELESRNQPERATQARAERDWLMAELTASTGLSGRARRFPDNPERARLAVGKAIRRAIRRIDAADASTGEHLRRTVHTGIRCVYRP
jgi:hypothetical protein